MRVGGKHELKRKEIFMEKKQNNDMTDLLTQASRGFDDYRVDYDAEKDMNINRISTQFHDVDKIIGGTLRPGTYCFPSGTSVGKTCLMQNIAENLAEQGVDVYYFSLEMSRNELYDRGISKLSFMADRDKAVMFSHMSGFKYTEEGWIRTQRSEYIKYEEEYQRRYGNRFHIIRPSMGEITATQIYDLVRALRHDNPDGGMVFVIDYFQIISADASKIEQAKDSKDKYASIALNLQNLALELKVPILFPCAIPKAEFSNKIDNSSPSGSSGIAFSANYMLGWNWVGVTDGRKREDADDERAKCRERGFRLMNLDAVKARSGEIGSGAYFLYYPAFNYLEPIDFYDAKRQGLIPGTDEAKAIELQKIAQEVNETCKELPEWMQLTGGDYELPFGDVSREELEAMWDNVDSF